MTTIDGTPSASPAASLDALVEAILNRPYTEPAFLPFVQTAELVLLDAIVCNPLLDAEPMRTTIKAWLTAHYWAVSNPLKRSRSINGASATLDLPTAADGLRGTPYGRQALALDTTGCLQKATTTKTRVGATWAGTVGPDGTTRDDWQAGV